MTMEQAVEKGYDEVQHANFWFLNFLFDTAPDTRTPARFTAVVAKCGQIVPSSQAETNRSATVLISVPAGGLKLSGSLT